MPALLKRLSLSLQEAPWSLKLFIKRGALANWWDNQFFGTSKVSTTHTTGAFLILERDFRMRVD